MTEKRKKDDDEPKVRYSGTGRELGPQEGDPVAAAKADPAAQIRAAQAVADAGSDEVPDATGPQA